MQIGRISWRRKARSGRSPDGMQWNPGDFGHARQAPDFAALHPGYIPPFF